MIFPVVKTSYGGNRMKAKWLLCGMLFVSTIGLMACMESKATEKEWETVEQERVSIHDPSILSLKDRDGRQLYYLFGSHLAQAKSKDLLTWQVPFTSEYENMRDNLIFADTDKTLKESFKWAGHNDADSAGGYSIWAPDVFWNEAYQWQDGSLGAYMYYYSATSTWRRSCIGFVVSKELEGKFQYGGTIVYSGFTQKDATDGSERNTNYHKTHLKQLIKEGTLSSFSNNWARDGVTYNTDYAPNAIDPAFFTDKAGKLWMTYGSWSGGIFLLEINPATGEPLYPGKDGKTTDGRIIDRYFGTKLAGGYHQSMEGPYIVYDQKASYYYLFATYGSLQADGGYNMRLFRSKEVTGPYVDAKGQSPIFGKTDKNEQFGVKLMGNYQFNGMDKAYKSGGHNSAFIADDGQWYLIYHTRFSGSEAHQVRVHQMVMNEEGWPLATPYEYREPLVKGPFKKTEIVGRYEVIKHGTDNSPVVNKSLKVSLETNGQLAGELEGTWELSTKTLEIKSEGVTYRGVLAKQPEECNQHQKVLTFSLLGDNNEVIWGSQITP